MEIVIVTASWQYGTWHGVQHLVFTQEMFSMIDEVLLVSKRVTVLVLSFLASGFFQGVVLSIVCCAFFWLGLPHKSER